jgi:hypothetical protein
MKDGSEPCFKDQIEWRLGCPTNFEKPADVTIYLILSSTACAPSAGPFSFTLEKVTFII